MSNPRGWGGALARLVFWLVIILFALTLLVCGVTWLLIANMR